MKYKNLFLWIFTWYLWGRKLYLNGNIIVTVHWYYLARRFSWAKVTENPRYTSRIYAISMNSVHRKVCNGEIPWKTNVITINKEESRWYLWNRQSGRRYFPDSAGRIIRHRQWSVSSQRRKKDSNWPKWTVDIDGASIGAAVKWPGRSVRWKRITKRSKGETNGKTE